MFEFLKAVQKNPFGFISFDHKKPHMLDPEGLYSKLNKEKPKRVEIEVLYVDEIELLNRLPRYDNGKFWKLEINIRKQQMECKKFASYYTYNDKFIIIPVDNGKFITNKVNITLDLKESPYTYLAVTMFWSMVTNFSLAKNLSSIVYYRDLYKILDYSNPLHLRETFYHLLWEEITLPEEFLSAPYYKVLKLLVVHTINNQQEIASLFFNSTPVKYNGETYTVEIDDKYKVYLKNKKGKTIYFGSATQFFNEVEIVDKGK